MCCVLYERARSSALTVTPQAVTLRPSHAHSSLTEPDSERGRGGIHYSSYTATRYSNHNTCTQISTVYNHRFMC